MQTAPVYYSAPAGAPMQAVPVQAQPVQAQYAYRNQPDLGGGFIEFLFGGDNGRAPRHQPAPAQPMAPPPVIMQQPIQQPMLQEPEVDEPPLAMAPPGSAYAYGAPSAPAAPARPAMDPRYAKQVVTYMGPEKAGTIIIDTPKRFLFLVQPGGKAIRYGIGVGRPGFTWAGVKSVSAKREWPDWRPPDEMLQRRPDLPRYMPGGPNNPLGARAMYLGSSLYRIHGSNEPWTIGHAVSSGCIRMRNEDVVDLYERVKVGTRVIVI
jgi:lipoprotein-anchoring transpeptidase ErfK/SrfK